MGFVGGYLLENWENGCDGEENNTTGLVYCTKNNPKECNNEAACLLKKQYSPSHICVCVSIGEPLLADSIRCPTKKSEKKDLKGSKIPIPANMTASLLSSLKTNKFKDISRNTTKGREMTTVPYLNNFDNVRSNQTNSTDIPFGKFNNTHEETIFNVEKSAILPVQYWIFAVPIVLILLATFVYLIGKCYMPQLFRFRRKKYHKNKALAVPLEKNILMEQRYTSNPQYTPAGVTPTDVSVGLADLGLPLLNKNSITDLEKIGEGFFGEVYKGQLYSKDNDEEHIEAVAVKMLKRTATPEALEDFMREVEIISSFHHPNILTLIGVCGQENAASPWMVFEFMQYGDLADVLRKSGGAGVPTLSMKELLSISLQIATGMEYLASQRFVHRDLACRNCLVGSGLTVKISDFGMSRDVYTCDYYRMGGSRMLPVRWMSPESMSFGKFTLESDVWSFGVVLWEIFSSGKQPYYGYTNEQVLKFIVKGRLLTIPDNCPSEVAHIMSMCWKDPKERMHFLEICNRLSSLIDNVHEVDTVCLPRPPPMPVTVSYPLPLDDEELDDNFVHDNYLRENSSSSSSRSSLNTYVEMLPS